MAKAIPLDESRLRELFHSDLTIPEAANSYGCSGNSLRKYWQKLGLVRGHDKSPATRAKMSQMRTKFRLPEEQLRELASQRLSTSEIGEVFGCSAEVVRETMIRYGIDRLPGKARPEKNYFWRGGRIEDVDGYILIKMNDHPYATKAGYVREHRLVMEQKLGRYLSPGEVVHHIDGNKQNNHPDNLEVFGSNADHLRHELTGRCPKWTEDGLKRLRESYQRGLALYHASRKASKTDDPAQP